MKRSILAILAALCAVVAIDAVPSWDEALRQTSDWYASPEATEVADSVLSYQQPSGGWPKNLNLSEPPSQAYLESRGKARHATIDNGATTSPLTFLARVNEAQPADRWKESIDRGIEYLLEAQYENGGWPQFYPLREGYYSHITFNDNATVRVLNLLKKVERAEAPWKGLGNSIRERAGDAVERGIECILKTQIRVDGQLTAWCAQHDVETLAPAKARAFELVSLSGGESVEIVRFLMDIEEPSPRVVAAIEGAVAWFTEVAIPGKRADRIKDENGNYDRVLRDDPEEDLWARFYEIGTNRPIFVGRDSVVHYELSEIEQERRGGYGYYGTWAKDMVSKEYPAWRRRLATQSDGPVLYLVGDSTMADKPRPTNPEKGWGQLLREYTLAPLRVDNHAVNGRSTKSFLDEGRWEDVLDRLKTDDWVLIQFGHNDEKEHKPAVYAEARTDYRRNILRMIEETRARGAHPILATSVARRKWDKSGERMVRTHGDYPLVVRQVANEQDVPLLEMEKLTTQLGESKGVEGSKKLHLWFEPGELAIEPEGLSDNTHYSWDGAREVAALAIAEMRRLELPIAKHFADALVALDDTGDWSSVEKAIYKAPQAPDGSARWIIRVKHGEYRERAYVQRERGNIRLVGDAAETTVLVEGIHANMIGPDGKKLGTFRTPTLQVDGEGFEVHSMTIANDAGPVGQALALRVDGDRVVFRDCVFKGWQDTIFVNRGRQYFENCYIEGHVDFIFGGAVSVFDKCHIHCLKNGYITAASTPALQEYGMVFLDCRITGEPGVQAYLGRPWRAHAQTTFVRTGMSEVVRPEGWHNWTGPEREETARYAEFGSYGPGGDMANRVPWARTLSEKEAAALDVNAIFESGEVVQSFTPAQGQLAR
ncbi:pectate lyase [Pelagicoccus sp. SDUM812002]|uniref:pectate lyase n=1 Tax=Pelagicoccus sp. SDUM812002 TaxID=3041266 RepID=UPI00280F67F4|nr:pectate lyase [Pelagicoccus sp. SDUM812002]MDQ8184348.1 pectate lyase [Pelagicoccus sp. SDUM812002]